MKKLFCILIALVLTFSLLTACSGNTSNKSAVSSENLVDTSDTATSPSPDPAETEELESETAKTTSSAGPAVLDVDAQDANLYDTKENAVPLGQWVYYQSKNYTSDQYEPFYVRIIGVSRSQTEIQAAIDSYSGIMDFTLSEDQAKDIEFGIVEYEIYFAPDYAAPDFGITIPSVNLGAIPKEGGFKTDDGVSYIGIGLVYKLNINGSSFYPKPGDIVHDKGLFTILKNYDESEYLFIIDWYDGEIVTEKARKLYFTAE